MVSYLPVKDGRDTYGQGDTWGSSTNAQDPTTTGDYSSKPMGSDSYGTSGYDTGAQRGTKMPGVMEGWNTLSFV